jgi:competence protein ComGC
MSFIKEYWQFLKERKKWWLIPMIIIFVIIGLLMILGSSPTTAPFIYTLF